MKSSSKILGTSLPFFSSRCFKLSRTAIADKHRGQDFGGIKLEPCDRGDSHLVFWYSLNYHDSLSIYSVYTVNMRYIYKSVLLVEIKQIRKSMSKPL